MGPKQTSGARSRRGTALAEYALLLTAICCSVLFGARLILTSVTWPSAELTGNLAAHGQSNTFAPETPEIIIVDDDSPAPEVGDTSVARQVGLLVVLFGVVVGSVVLLRTLRRRTPAPSEKPHSEEAPKQTPAPFAVKRREIFNVLSKNVGDLLTSHLSVGQIQTKKPVCVQLTTKREELEEMMHTSQFHHLLVCDAHGQLAGILSDRDFRAGSGKTAGEIMTDHPYTIDATAEIRTAISMLLSHRISALPVVEDGRPIGIMTVTDLVLMLQATLQLLDKLHMALSDEEAHSPAAEHVEEKELAMV